VGAPGPGPRPDFAAAPARAIVRWELDQVARLAKGMKAGMKAVKEADGSTLLDDLRREP
jgi:hypothetical protein